MLQKGRKNCRFFGEHGKFQNIFFFLNFSVLQKAAVNKTQVFNMHQKRIEKTAQKMDIYGL